uniref:Trichothecene efflux pump n=2 Tax=Fusarium sambucinum species complex TaxID=569360 RepID=A0A1P8JAG1_9HYPO|nr:trichothecene efflux pump [Fusarium louisianense]APW30735.1 trichothecene efflux pump [Fusarium ussurianum]
MTATVHEKGVDLESQPDDRLRAQALATTADELPEGYYTSPRVIASFAAFSLNVCATYFVLQASASALPNILQDIGQSENQGLFSTLWTMGQAVSILVMGRLTDRFGRRPFVIATHIIGLVGAIIGCTANEFNTLLAAMTLLGVAAGPAGSSPLFVGELMSNKTKFLGLLTVSTPSIVMSAGPYFGQRLSIQGNWRWIFYIYIIMSAVAALLIVVWYHPPSFRQLHGKKARKRDELAKLDWIGIFLVTAGVSLFLLGISWGGKPNNPWNSGKIIGLMTSGLGSLVVFALYEVFGKPVQPMIPPVLFKDTRGFVCILLISSIMGAMNLCLTIIYPQQVINIFGSSLKNWQETAWMTATASFGTWAGVIILGNVFHLIRHIRWQILVGAMWLTAFLGAMSSVNRDNKNAAIALSFFSGFVVGWAQDITMLMVQFITTDEDLGVAFCMYPYLYGRDVSNNNQYPKEIGSHLTSAMRGTDIPQASFPSLLEAAKTGRIDAVKALPGMTNSTATVVNQAMADSYTASYANVYYFAMALGVIPIIASLCMRDFDRYLTDHVPHQLYDRKKVDKDVLEGDSDTPSSPTIHSTVEVKE